jgi:hypothetical protein
MGLETSEGTNAVWRRQRPILRRYRRLEQEVAAARAESADLRRRLDLMEMVVAAAGAQAATAVPSAPLPPELLAAARDLHQHDVPVRLEVAGADVIAVVRGAGDPSEWWTSIWQLADPTGNAS